MHSKEEGTWMEDGGGDGAARDASPTMGIVSVETLTDVDLLARTRRLVCQSNRVLGALLAHLAEVEARGLHRTNIRRRSQPLLPRSTPITQKGFAWCAFP